VPGRHEPVEVPPPAVDIADETFLRVPAAVLAPVVADTASWITWWPDLVPHVTRDRGAKGQQWAVTGALVGSMEVWLEPVGDGTVVHWYLRADPPSPLSARRVRRLRERRVLAWKRHMFVLKDRLEAFKPGAGPADDR
jgi:hypothetical protein